MKKALLALSLFSGLICSALAEDSTKDRILYVCGANTGRSVMAEWYTRHWYSSKVETFSRGSGIDPDDDSKTENFAKDLILANHDAGKNEINARAGTPVSITDIYKSTIVLTMGPKYSDRLKNLIARECSSFNLDYPNRSFNQAQWAAMCKNPQLLEAKIHTLVGCATGIDGEIGDAYGKDKPFYVKVRNQITENISRVMRNHAADTTTWCKPQKPLQ